MKFVRQSPSGADVMKTVRWGLVVSFILSLCIDAHAVSLTLEGAGTGVSVGNSQALWASNSAGRAVQITAVGMRAPDGGKVSELGVPSMMPDGRVVFGAEVTTKGEKDPPIGSSGAFSSAIPMRPRNAGSLRSTSNPSRPGAIRFIMAIHIRLPMWTARLRSWPRSDATVTA